jgi:penicillin-binding protein 2
LPELVPRLEKAGLVPSNEWKLKKMHDGWHQGDTVNIAIGQGPLWVTPLQMASLISVVANKGIQYQPYIVDTITTPKGEIVYKAVSHKRKELQFADHSWDLLHQGLETVVTNGTGRGCFFPDIRVAGKTGTAQNPQGDDHAWFVSFAPVDNPQLAVAVIVENGGHGGTAAVPIARQIYETAFGKVKEATEVAASSKIKVSSGTAVTIEQSVAVSSSSAIKE